MSNIFDKLRSYIWSFVKLFFTLLLASVLLVYVPLYFIDNVLWHKLNDSITSLFVDTNKETKQARENAKELGKDLKELK